MSPKRKKIGNVITWAGVALAINMLILDLIKLGFFFLFSPKNLLSYIAVMTSQDFNAAYFLSAFFGFILCLVGMFVSWRVKLPISGIGLIIILLTHNFLTYTIPPH